MEKERKINKKIDQKRGSILKKNKKPLNGESQEAQEASDFLSKKLSIPGISAAILIAIFFGFFRKSYCREY